MKEDSRDNNSLEEIRTKEMPRYNNQAQMDAQQAPATYAKQVSLY